MKKLNWTGLVNAISLLSTIVLIIWWTAKLDSRICTLEGFMRDVKPQVEQLASMRQADEQMLRALTKIETSLDRVLDKMWQLHTPDHQPLRDVGK